MKDYTYKGREIELVQHLLNNPPKNIWWNFVWYAFDYGNYYLKLECVPEVADTQNKLDEAIIATLTKENNGFEPSEHTILVCQDKTIDKAFIVRTFLYFTTYREYSALEKFAKRAAVKIKSFLTGKDDSVGDLLSQAIGGCEEIICHPKSEQAKKVNPNYANIIDVGLLLEINGKYLRAYLVRL